MDLFIRKKDYYSLIEEDELTTILEDANEVENDIWLNERMFAAMEEVGTYLSHYYDTNLIFAPVAKWVDGTTYNIGDIVYYEVDNLTYKSLDLHINSGPPDLASNWEETTDPRNPMIKKHVLDWALYDINTRLNPRNIPEIRILRREQSETWLTRISKGQINAGNLPKIDPEEDQAGPIMFGSETKTQNNF